MEITKSVSKWGNGAGILLPKEWIGNQVKIICIDRTLEIKKEVFSILYPYLEDIIGIYLVGSYARGEETADSDIDIIAVSDSIKKDIFSSKYHISIITLENLKKTLHGDYPELILPRLMEAKALLNKKLLEELKNIRISRNSFKAFVEDTERIIKINEGILSIEKNKGELTSSASIAYSIILRLRGVFLIKAILKNKKYSSKDFKNWICSYLNEETFNSIYNAYSDFKRKKHSKIKLKIEDLEKLLVLLKKELKKW
jgi:predicted nucleotidyltransferase